MEGNGGNKSGGRASAVERKKGKSEQKRGEIEKKKQKREKERLTVEEENRDNGKKKGKEGRFQV